MNKENVISRARSVGERPRAGRSPSERRGIAGASPGARLAERANQSNQEATAADRKIRSLIEDRLAMFGPLIAEQIDVSVKNSRVVLSGDVDTAYERQAVLHMVGQLAYIKHLRSQIRVGGEDVAEAPSVWDRINEQKIGFAVSVAGVVAALWWLWTLK